MHTVDSTFHLSLHCSVDRPLNTHKVMWVSILSLNTGQAVIVFVINFLTSHSDKEVHLPFPQEHPYTSHISQFAVFPDTKYRQPLLNDSKQQPCKKKNLDIATPQEALLPRTASIQTQTALSSFKPLPTYYVPQKAGEWGVRVEEHHLSKPGIASLNPNVGRTFWDLPRSRQHRVRLPNEW